MLQQKMAEWIEEFEGAQDALEAVHGGEQKEG